MERWQKELAEEVGAYLYLRLTKKEEAVKAQAANSSETTVTQVLNELNIINDSKVESVAEAG
ncbi:MAG: hypothetical protein MRQ07_00240 [Candidatus Midichloria sp.]|nr:hypothetical protein [Candidatus Midichloria sp.]